MSRQYWRDYHHCFGFLLITAPDSVSRGQFPCPCLQRQRNPQICQTCKPQKLLGFYLQSILWLLFCVLWMNKYIYTYICVYIVWFSWNLCLIFLLWTQITSVHIQRSWAAPWELFGIQCFAQGHFDMWTEVAGDWTTKPFDYWNGTTFSRKM